MTNSIVLLHGALGNANDLEPLAAKLKAINYQVHMLRFSGHGKKPFETKFDIEQFTNELKSFILCENLIKPLVFGYSMGGYVALNCAQQFPDLIGKIITLGTKFNWSNEAVTKETKSLNPESIILKVPAFAAMLEKKHGANWKMLLEKTAKLMWDINQQQYLKPNLLKQINLPVRLGLADKDNMVTYEEIKTVFELLPLAQMYILPGGKHPLESVPIHLMVEIIKSV